MDLQHLHHKTHALILAVLAYFSRLVWGFPGYSSKHSINLQNWYDHSGMQNNEHASTYDNVYNPLSVSLKSIVVVFGFSHIFQERKGVKKSPLELISWHFDWSMFLFFSKPMSEYFRR